MHIIFQFLVALRWMAKGEAAGFHGISKASVSRIVDKVSQWICTMARDEISYPENRLGLELVHCSKEKNCELV